MGIGQLHLQPLVCFMEVHATSAETVVNSSPHERRDGQQPGRYTPSLRALLPVDPKPQTLTLVPVRPEPQADAEATSVEMFGTSADEATSSTEDAAEVVPAWARRPYRDIVSGLLAQVLRLKSRGGV